jgi:allantoicase/malate synthase/CubicO group peptidase (beta-lactamase class C family)
MEHSTSATTPFFEIPSYHDYISPALARHLLQSAQSVPGVRDLIQVGESPDLEGGLETPESLAFLAELYAKLSPSLQKILAQRTMDRKFIDERAKACFEFNQKLGRDFLDPDYKTILGLEDGNGRVVIGPLSANYCRAGGKPVAAIPEFLQGPHVTLFGPPDSAKMAINAMNAYHRKLKGEPAIVEELLRTHSSVPKWGADDEDSKTPLREDLVSAGKNLTDCFERTIALEEAGKKYALAAEKLSVPIKRFPGLALPCTFLFYKKNPIPLHLYDFALHLFRNWKNPQALAFYVPKLENEEEARYIHEMVSLSESLIHQRHPEYKLGSIRLMIVLENPRAILRAHEIMDALHPYFVGASLGWHDYLASTARVFKEDGNYRIPVKADPNIVIKYIKASHRLLADVVGSRGGIKVGGMYGILPLNGDLQNASFQVTLKGFFKDVITQLKRDLTGFWVAHPDFVRLGLAIVEAWGFYKKGQTEPLFRLTQDLLGSEHGPEIQRFIEGADIEGLDIDDPNYVRSLLVADIKESDYIANNHPDEIRFNVFQSLQYLTDWLSGNGCVALPALVSDVPVRVMDDLATAERSRWEVWHEIHHGRFSVKEFLKIAHEEMHFIRKDLSNDKKIVQVKWDARTEKWYPIAFQLMLQLMTSPQPVEFATELLMPFTVESIRNADNPMAELQKIDGRKWQLEPFVEKYNYYFEMCGCDRFADTMASVPFYDGRLAQQTIQSFSVEEVLQAASFHGNIGEGKKTLDAMAAREQALVLEGEEAFRSELKSLGEQYLKKFGFKFLISAQGKSGMELLAKLKERLNQTYEQELALARLALWEITQKRITEHPFGYGLADLTQIFDRHPVLGASLAVTDRKTIQSLSFGYANQEKTPVTASTFFELASLSKTIASAFAIEYMKARKISLDTSVTELLAQTKSRFRLAASENKDWGDQVTLRHLMNHGALNMHYVHGVPLHQALPNTRDLISGNRTYKYDSVVVRNEPGTKFNYSGGGFLVLEHLIEAMEERPIAEIVTPFLEALELKHLTFETRNLDGQAYASGFLDSGLEVEGSRLQFPAFAAGALGTAKDTMRFLQHLETAYHNLDGSGGISHDTAREMLWGSDKGCREFMGCQVGLGVFVAEAGENKIALHQGANDGFRGLYLHCFDGPDRGKGFVIFCNGDNKGVLLISELAQEILRALQFSGIDFGRFQRNFDFQNLKQEEIVNLGYKNLIFSAFEPMLPPRIEHHGVRDPLADFNLLVGAEILQCSNQKFARAENLLSPHLPVFDPELFCPQGKVMDSWETVRHNPEAHDILDLKLAKTARIQYVSLSTMFHDGNQAEFVRILGHDHASSEWQEILPKMQMLGHAGLQIKLPEPTPKFDVVRVEMHPDGGLSRVGLYSDLPADQKKNFRPLGEACPTRFQNEIPKSKKPLTIPFTVTKAEIAKNRARAPHIDFASAAFGAKVLSASNEHYSPASQVISPFPPIHMFDGFESARSRKPGHSEEVVIELAEPVVLENLIMDFKYFVNNNPLAVSIDGWLGDQWTELTPKTLVKAFAGGRKRFLFERPEKFQKLLIRIYPDGGINRIHVQGCP